MPVEQISSTNAPKAGRYGINLTEANRQLAELSPLERIRWASDKLDENLILLSSFGPTSPVLLKLATEVLPEIPVVTIRHGYETDKTYEIADAYMYEFFLNLQVIKAPKLSIPGEDTPKFKEFQRKIKTEPLQKAIRKFRPLAYLSGAMHWQTPERRSKDFIEDRGSVLAVHPLLDMTEKQVDDFFLATGLPRNDDYYDPAKGEHQNRECSLNTSSCR